MSDLGQVWDQTAPVSGVSVAHISGDVPSLVGRLLHLWIWWDGTSTIDHFSDNATVQNFYLIQASGSDGSPQINLAMVTAPIGSIPVSGLMTVTVHFTGSVDNCSLAGCEYRGTAIAAPIIDTISISVGTKHGQGITDDLFTLVYDQCIILAGVYAPGYVINPVATFNQRALNSLGQCAVDTIGTPQPRGPQDVAPFQVQPHSGPTVMLIMGLLDQGSTLPTASMPTAAPPTVRRGPKGIFQIDENIDTDPTNYPCWTQDTVSGCYYRASWANTEPSPEQYNWSEFDLVMTLAIQNNKYAAFTLATNSAGPSTPSRQPAWLADFNCSTYTYWDKTNTISRTGFAPWDPVFLKYLEKLLNVMGARYDNDPHLAYIAWGTGCGDLEAFITKGTNGLPQLNALGGVAIWREATIKTASFYAESFLNTPNIFITGDPVPGDTTTLPNILANLTQAYGPLFGFKSNGTTADKQPNPLFAQYCRSHAVGFQPSGLNADTAQITEILANGYLLGGLVSALGGQFFEFYVHETTDPDVQPVFRVYATLLFPPPVPIPIDLTMGAAPLGWRGTIADFLLLFAASLEAELDPTFLIGQTLRRNNAPSHDIGPWFDGYGWWFFDPLTGAYQPSDQGCPVGTITMWGGGFRPPRNWLLCTSGTISRSQFSRLFQAIGETWGAGDGQTTFQLPPYACVFINAAGFTADPAVPLTTLTAPDGTTSTKGQGPGARGGSELSRLLLASDLPNMLAQMYQQYYNLDNTHTPASDIANPWAGVLGAGNQRDFAAVGLDGSITGQNQVPISIMPPFVTINYIIKYL